MQIYQYDAGTDLCMNDLPEFKLRTVVKGLGPALCGRGALSLDQ